MKLILELNTERSYYFGTNNKILEKVNHQKRQ